MQPETPPETSPRPSVGDSWERWETGLLIGPLFKVGGDSESNYTLLSSELFARTPAHWLVCETDAGDLVWRAQARLLLQGMADGPEDYYAGLAFGPLFEWQLCPAWSVYAGAGGGAGLTNAAGSERGGLGQDLTFNWYIQAGWRWELDPAPGGWNLQGAVLFQHNSNLGLSDPNPGLDLLGLTLGVAYHW